ncbi:transglycosylase SLT domain-containing protein [Rhodopseudomonas sp. HC1]|uniref:transglycosylase SLT domain-containing protein n=1 Tax=Rhodopseudomonas infernalis TaxID=2897386 RepID=UPI001EE96E66|nr:transglycosylase SLT domain-containing protein [Rhodopseudomonas infernalis]MCG6206022.1 transglycosylase SLT domain-containing protein [Rhodopseudomonas infernalis]
MSTDIVTSAVTIVDQARTRIAGAIKQAAGATGASFEYLLTTAKMESDFNPQAAASTSSAKGLYQFIDQTWLGTVKEAGAQFGYGAYADAISKSPSGSYSVSDPAARQAIMDLRNDPAISSAMAGALTQSNSSKLTAEIGRRPNDAELYMAHFMGAGGAAKLITAAQDNPNAVAAAMFPNAAAANQSIFYDRTGNARSVAQVYDNLTSRYTAAASSPATQSALIAAGGAPVMLASAAPVDNAAYLSSFPDVRHVAPASGVSSANAAPSATQQPGEPMFRTLFLGGDRNEAISPAVQQLWTNPVTPTSASTPAMSSSSATSLSYAPTAPTPPSGLSYTPTVRTPTPLDLFSDRTGTFAS